MIKNILYILVLLYSTISYSQNYKSLKGKDTVYFYFDYSKNLKKETYNSNNKGTGKRYVYQFTENHSEEKFQRYFRLLRPKNLFEKDQKDDMRIITKSFLRKNKDIIIYPKDLKGNRMEKIINSRSLKIVVYIIDVAEKRKRKFIAHEVRLSDIPFIEI